MSLLPTWRLYKKKLLLTNHPLCVRCLDDKGGGQTCVFVFFPTTERGTTTNKKKSKIGLLVQPFSLAIFFPPRTWEFFFLLSWEKNPNASPLLICLVAFYHGYTIMVFLFGWRLVGLKYQHPVEDARKGTGFGKVIVGCALGDDVNARLCRTTL